MRPADTRDLLPVNGRRAKPRNIGDSREWLKRVETGIIIDGIAAEQLVFLAEFVVHAACDLIDAASHHRRRHKVLPRVVHVRNWIKRGDAGADRINLAGRDDVIRE